MIPVMSSPNPIFQFIRGIDKNRRYLAEDEIERLTSVENGKGDWFAQWLASTAVDKRTISLRSLLNDALPKDSYRQGFAVADGISIEYDHEDPNNPLNSVSRSLRFVIIALPDSNKDTQNLSEAIVNRTLCIVGSNNPDGTSTFLQCASWDPTACGKGKGMMRFYERQGKNGEWVFVGDSTNAVGYNPRYKLLVAA